MSKYYEFVDPYDKAGSNIFIRAEHLARYLFAAEFIGKRRLASVLDAACGNGYGSRILAGRAESVQGVDRNAALIERGRDRIRRDSVQNAELYTGDLNECLGWYRDGEFDCIVCFETLEHVENDGLLLFGFRRVLRRGGALLLSVPKAGYEPAGSDGKPENPYHLRLYDETGLTDLLGKNGFSVERMLGQPYSNAARVRMEDWRRDTGVTEAEIGGYFNESAESLEFYAKVWGWPAEELQEKSNTIMAVCGRN